MRKLVDSTTGFEVANITGGESLTIDEALALSRYTLEYTEDNPEGQLQDEDGEYVGAYYDSLELVAE